MLFSSQLSYYLHLILYVQIHCFINKNKKMKSNTRKQQRKIKLLIGQYETQIEQNRTLVNRENGKLENKFLQEILELLNSKLISINK